MAKKQKADGTMVVTWTRLEPGLKRYLEHRATLEHRTLSSVIRAVLWKDWQIAQQQSIT